MESEQTVKDFEEIQKIIKLDRDHMFAIGVECYKNYLKKIEGYIDRIDTSDILTMVEKLENCKEIILLCNCDEKHIKKQKVKVVLLCLELVKYFDEYINEGDVL